MNNIPRVPPPHALRKNTAHDKTSSLLLSPPQTPHKNTKGLYPYSLPPQLLRALVARVVSLLQGGQKHPQNKSPSKQKPPYKNQRNNRERSTDN